MSATKHETIQKKKCVSRNLQLNLQRWDKAAAVMGVQRRCRFSCASGHLLTQREAEEKNRWDQKVNISIEGIFCRCYFIVVRHLLCSAHLLCAQVSLFFQGCVAVQDEETLMLKAPKESQNMRTAERGVTQSIHKFSFSKVGGTHLCTVLNKW